MFRFPECCPGAWGGGGLIFVSDVVRAVIEEIEPGVHQFVPLTLEHEGKAEPFHMLRIATFLPAVDADRSEVDWDEIKLPGGGTDRIWTKRYRVPLRLDPDVIGKHHLWREESAKRMTFMSDHLHQALVAGDLLRGLYVEKQITE